MNTLKKLGGYVVIFNGPPRSGKDTLAKYLCGATLAVPRAFKTQLVSIALTIAGVSREEWGDWYEMDKEAPRDELWGHSCRSFLILISEDMIKPHLSPSYFGEIEAKSMAGNQLYLSEYGAVYSDSGFNEELSKVVEAVGADRVIVVQLHRQGTTFNGDSRKYLDRDQFPGVVFLQQQNDRPAEEVAGELLDTLLAIIEDKKS